MPGAWARCSTVSPASFLRVCSRVSRGQGINGTRSAGMAERNRHNREEHQIYPQDSAADDTLRDGTMPPVDDPIGLFYTWWQGDPLPTLRAVDGLTVERTEDTQFVDVMTDSDLASIRERIGQGQSPWVARIGDQPVGWGWVATHEASIGELQIRLAIPPRNSYLWDFVTLPAWRGLGVYPHLLQAVLKHHTDVDRFWLGHDTPNVASARGIVRAGFQVIGAVHRLFNGTLALVVDGQIDRSAAGAALLGLPVVGYPRGYESQTPQAGA